MLFDDTYLTIEAPSEGIFKDRGSKFLSYAYPINNDASLKDHLTQLRAQHPKANHHCWAMRLTADRSVFRVNDDGEPAGTAGRPILNTLLSHNLTNLAVVVVRYFGGTLLGVPGLISAYKTATEEALKQATIVERTVNDVYTIKFDYLQINDIMRMIKEDRLDIIDQSLNNNCSIRVSIRKMQVNQTLAKLNKLNGVTATFEYTL